MKAHCGARAEHKGGYVGILKVPIDQFLPLTEVRDNFSSIIDRLSSSDDPSDLYVVTQDGKPSAAIVSIDALVQLMKKTPTAHRATPPSDDLDDRPNTDSQRSLISRFATTDLPLTPRPEITPRLASVVPPPPVALSPADKSPASPVTPGVPTPRGYDSPVPAVSLPIAPIAPAPIIKPLPDGPAAVEPPRTSTPMPAPPPPTPSPPVGPLPSPPPPPVFRPPAPLAPSTFKPTPAPPPDRPPLAFHDRPNTPPVVIPSPTPSIPAVIKPQSPPPPSPPPNPPKISPPNSPPIIPGPTSSPPAPQFPPSVAAKPLPATPAPSPTPAEPPSANPAVNAAAAASLSALKTTPAGAVKDMDID